MKDGKSRVNIQSTFNTSKNQPCCRVNDEQFKNTINQNGKSSSLDEQLRQQSKGVHTSAPHQIKAQKSNYRPESIVAQAVLPNGHVAPKDLQTPKGTTQSHHSSYTPKSCVAPTASQAHSVCLTPVARVSKLLEAYCWFAKF